MTSFKDLREFVKDAKESLRACKTSSKTYKTSIAKKLNADYAVLLTPYTKRMIFVPLNDTGFTTDGAEWASGALGNLRMYKLPIYLASSELFVMASNLAKYAYFSNYIHSSAVGKHTCKFLKDFAKIYNYS